MLSDVLFDAIQRVEQYERRFPQVYKPLALEIAETKRSMADLLIRLDTAPEEAVRPRHDLRVAPVEGIDLSTLPGFEPAKVADHRLKGSDL